MLNRISKLLKSYESFISVPWSPHVSAEERAIFVVYPKEDELKLRHRVPEFELATTQNGHDWLLLDITNSFAEWMSEQDYKEAYFEDPEYLESNYEFFAEDLAEKLKAKIEASQTENTVVALVGCSSLFGFASVSSLVKEVAQESKGRLLVFFPGDYSENNYQLLDAKDGWGYQATPITVTQ